MLKLLADWLEAQTGLVVGAEIQTGAARPNAPTPHATIRASGGPLSFTTNYAAPRVQVVSVGGDYFEAEGLAIQISKAMHGRSGIDLYTGSVLTFAIHTIEAAQKPFYLGASQSGKHQFTQNFIVRLDDKS